MSSILLKQGLFLLFTCNVLGFNLARNSYYYSPFILYRPASSEQLMTSRMRSSQRSFSSGNVFGARTTFEDLTNNDRREIRPGFIKRPNTVYIPYAVRSFTPIMIPVNKQVAPSTPFIIRRYIIPYATFVPTPTTVEVNESPTCCDSLGNLLALNKYIEEQPEPEQSVKVEPTDREPIVLSESSVDVKLDVVKSKESSGVETQQVGIKQKIESTNQKIEEKENNSAPASSASSEASLKLAPNSETTLELELKKNTDETTTNNVAPMIVADKIEESTFNTHEKDDKNSTITV